MVAPPTLAEVEGPFPKVRFQEKRSAAKKSPMQRQKDVEESKELK
jgi:hypothetical protein